MGWGDCNWGQFFWGADSCSVAGLGSVADTKPDTVFYGTSATGVVATLATDLSQHGVNFTAGATFIHSANAEARLTPRTRFAMETRVDVNTGTTSGTIMSLRDEVGATQLLQVTRFGATFIRLIVNGASIAAISLAGLVAGDRKIQIMVSATPNPLTTGASDAVSYEMTIHEEVTGDEHFIRMNAAVFTSTSDFVMTWNAQDSAGTDAYAEGFFRARYGRAFHSPTEMWEDWVLATAAGASKVRAGVPEPLPDRSQLTIANQDEFSGPAYRAGSRNTRAQSYYCVTPAVNYMTDTVVSYDQADVDNVKLFQDTFGTGTKYTRMWVFARVPPPHMNRWRFGFSSSLTATTGAQATLDLVMTATGRWLNGKGNDGDLARTTTGSTQSAASSSTTLRNAVEQWFSIPASNDGFIFFMMGVDFVSGNAADTFSVSNIQIEWGRSEQSTLTGVGGG